MMRAVPVPMCAAAGSPQRGKLFGDVRLGALVDEVAVVGFAEGGFVADLGSRCRFAHRRESTVEPEPKTRGDFKSSYLRTAAGAQSTGNEGETPCSISLSRPLTYTRNACNHTYYAFESSQ
jgi:hypothetical protein